MKQNSFKLFLLPDQNTAQVCMNDDHFSKPFANRLHVEIYASIQCFQGHIGLEDFFNIISDLEKTKAPFNNIVLPTSPPNVSFAYFNTASKNPKDLEKLLKSMIDDTDKNPDRNKPWFPFRNAPVGLNDAPLWNICTQHVDSPPHGHITWPEMMTKGIFSHLEGLAMLYGSMQKFPHLKLKFFGKKLKLQI